MAGRVYIVGAGPGDPGLITVRAKQLLELADVVVYDYLVNISLLGYCTSSCEKIYVGKKAGDHTFSQEQINEILYSQVIEGNKVVRLKGGDPFVFGRGGEEAQYLAQRNIAFEIVPGITSGIAAPAYAGIPVTHRNLTSTVTFITGHEAEGKDGLNINWQALASLKGTLVFYMGVRNLALICNQLITNGLSKETPVAIIRFGTYNSQQTVKGTLETIGQIAKETEIKPPALIVVGDVVSLSDELNWFANKPLLGKRILVTRSRIQASELSKLLNEKGAEVIELPTIEILPIDDYSALHNSFRELSQYQWIVFTSVNAVDYFFHELNELGYDSRLLGTLKLVSIGIETTKALHKYGLAPDLVPDKFIAEGIVDSFRSIDIKGNNILLPTSNLARDIISKNLAEMGAKVAVIPVYQNQIPKYEKDFLEHIFSKPIDCITFTSSSTVNNFFALLKEYGIENPGRASKIASIGPITSKAITDRGFIVDIQAEVFTTEHLANEIEKFFSKV